MQIQKKSHKKSKIIITLVLLLLGAGGIIGYYKFYRPSEVANQEAAPVNTVNYNPPTDQEKQDSQAQKEEAAKQMENEASSQQNQQQGGSSGSSTPAQTTTAISISLTRVSQASKGQPVNIRAVISGTTTGQCIATITKPGQPTITKTFTIAFEATSAACQSADVPASEFTADGDWTVSVVAKNGSVQSAPASKVVTIAR